MSYKNRRIKYHRIFLRNTRHENEIEPAYVLRDLFTWIAGKTAIDRQFRVSNEKYCYLSSANIPQGIHKVIFKSARDQFRPPVINSVDLRERDNPKLITEGDRLMTHAAVKYGARDVTMVLETNKFGVSIHAILKYLNQFYAEYCSDQGVDREYILFYQTSVNDDFLAAVGRMSRVTLGEVIVDKQILGSEALNFSDRISTVRQEVYLKIKANRADTIKNAVIDTYHRTLGNPIVLGMWVEGKDEDNAIVVANTDEFERARNIRGEVNEETGEIISGQFMESLVRLASEIP